MWGLCDTAALCKIAQGFGAILHWQLGGPRPLWALVAAGSTGRDAFPGCGCAGQLRVAQTPLICSPALPSSSKQHGCNPVASKTCARDSSSSLAMGDRAPAPRNAPSPPVPGLLHMGISPTPRAPHLPVGWSPGCSQGKPAPARSLQQGFSQGHHAEGEEKGMCQPSPLHRHPWFYRKPQHCPTERDNGENCTDPFGAAVLQKTKRSNSRRVAGGGAAAGPSPQAPYAFRVRWNGTGRETGFPKGMCPCEAQRKGNEVRWDRARWLLTEGFVSASVS